MPGDFSAYIDHGNAVISLDPIADQATDANGAALTLASAPAVEYLIIAIVGTSVFTPTDSNKLSLELEESVDGTNYTDVADANLSRVALTTLGAAAANVGTFAIIDDSARDAHVYTCKYVRTSKAVVKLRVVHNFAGTVTGGIPIATAILPINPGKVPTAA